MRKGAQERALHYGSAGVGGIASGIFDTVNSRKAAKLRRVGLATNKVIYTFNRISEHMGKTLVTFFSSFAVLRCYI